MKALVVDDSDAVRGMLADHLARIGFEVAQAADGFEAIAQAADPVHPDVVLLDWDLPFMDGVEVLRRLRAESRTATVPVIMVATEHELPFLDRALDAGANEWLVKPFDAQALLERLLLLGLDPEGRRAA
jgi:two-component system chemotaxis response regulator CheY